MDTLVYSTRLDVAPELKERYIQQTQFPNQEVETILSTQDISKPSPNTILAIAAAFLSRRRSKKHESLTESLHSLHEPTLQYCYEERDSYCLYTPNVQYETMIANHYNLHLQPNSHSMDTCCDCEEAIERNVLRKSTMKPMLDITCSTDARIYL